MVSLFPHLILRNITQAPPKQRNSEAQHSGIPWSTAQLSPKYTESDDQIEGGIPIVKREPPDICDDPDESNSNWRARNIGDFGNHIGNHFPFSDGVYNLSNYGILGEMKPVAVLNNLSKKEKGLKVKGAPKTPKSTSRKRQAGKRKNPIPMKVSKQESDSIISETAHEGGGLVNAEEYFALFSDNDFNDESYLENSDTVKSEGSPENERVLQQCPHCEFKHMDKYRFRYHLYTKHNDLSAGKPRIHNCDKCEYSCFRWENIIFNLYKIYINTVWYVC